MAFEGWMSLAGLETVNAARTVTLVRANLPSLDLRDCAECVDLAAALGDEPYGTLMHGENGCVNPSADANTSGWEAIDATFVLSRSTSEFHSSPASFQAICARPGGDPIYGSAVYSAPQVTPVFPAGTLLRWSVWIRADRVGSAYVAPVVNYAQIAGQRQVAVTTAWQQVVIDAVIPDESTNFYIIIGTKDPANITLWFDDVFIGPMTEQPSPWSTDPDLADFYGLYPLSFTGVSDATYTTVVTESLLDGGSIALGRRATREMRMTGMLIAGSAYGLNAGIAWFRGALRGSQCGGGMTCAGDDMCYFAACPTEATADKYQRTLRDVVVTEGPIVMREYAVAGCGAYMAQVEFTIVAGTPWAYTLPVLLGRTMGTPGTTVGIDVDFSPPMLPSCVGVQDAPAVTDPLLPVRPSPPRPPDPGLPGSDLSYGSGFSILVPADVVAQTNDTVLLIRITTGTQAARYVRVRLYAAPMAPIQSVHDLDPCSFCAEVVLSYIPPNTTLVLDGMNQTIYLEYPDGTKVNASHLAHTVTLIGVDWPVVSCDMNYWLTVEFPGPETGQVIVGDNSDFSDGTGSWTGVRTGAETTIIEQSPTHVHSASFALRARWPTQVSPTMPAASLTQVTLVPGNFYEWSAWVYVPTGSPPVRLSVATPSGAALLSDVSTTLDAFELLTITAAAPQSSMIVSLSPTTPTTFGQDAWLDDVQCRNLSTGVYSVVDVSVSTVQRS